ncbi:PilZ domain protein [bacterium BMS3Bbin08]|nr:PilZ domain protein [bacterium BMS3Bbin08]
MPVSIEAELYIGGKHYEGVIENLSAEGFHFSAVPSKMPSDLYPGDEVELAFNLPSEETLILQCNVKWAEKTRPESTPGTLGLEITERSFEYDDFYMNTYSNYMGIIQKDGKDVRSILKLFLISS